MWVKPQVMNADRAAPIVASLDELLIDVIISVDVRAARDASERVDLRGNCIFGHYFLLLQRLRLLVSHTFYY